MFVNVIFLHFNRYMYKINDDLRCDLKINKKVYTELLTYITGVKK